MGTGTDRAVRRGAIALIMTLLLIVTATVVAVVSPDAREWVRARMHWAPAGFTVGAASGLPPHWYRGADYTVVIFATGNCDACRRAEPFHAAVAQLLAGRTSARAVVALTSPGDDAAAYARALGVTAEMVTLIDPRGLKLRRVPTLVIVDRDGVVRIHKEGVLPEIEQHALIETLRALLTL